MQLELKARTMPEDHHHPPPLRDQIRADPLRFAYDIIPNIVGPFPTTGLAALHKAIPALFSSESQRHIAELYVHTATALHSFELQNNAQSKDRLVDGITDFLEYAQKQEILANYTRGLFGLTPEKIKHVIERIQQAQPQPVSSG